VREYTNNNLLDGEEQEERQERRTRELGPEVEKIGGGRIEKSSTCVYISDYVSDYKRQQTLEAINTYLEISQTRAAN
jgi:hypothetical protein